MLYPFLTSTHHGHWHPDGGSETCSARSSGGQRCHGGMLRRHQGGALVLSIIHTNDSDNSNHMHDICTYIYTQATHMYAIYTRAHTHTCTYIGISL